MRGRRRPARRAFLRWWSVATERAHPVTRTRRRHRRRVDGADPGRWRTSSSSLFRLRLRFGRMQHLRRVIEGHLLLLGLGGRRCSALVRAAGRSLARELVRRHLRFTLTLIATLQRLPWPPVVLLLDSFRNRRVRTTALVQRRGGSAARTPRFRAALVTSAAEAKERTKAALATLHLRWAVPLSLRLGRHRQRLCPRRCPASARGRRRGHAMVLWLM